MYIMSLQILPYVFRINDCLLRVNNVDVSTMKYEKAIEAINQGDSLNIVSIFADICRT